MKRGAKIVAVMALYLSLASGVLAQTPEIIEKPDPALGVTLFAPKKVKSIGVNQGLLKMDRIKWRVYPVVYQQTDKAQKLAAMMIDILGPMNGGFTNAPLTVNIDGQVTTIPVTWTSLNTVFGDNAVSTKIALRDATFRKLAGAAEVYLSILVPGTTDRYTVHLTGEYLAVFKTMLNKYDALEPHEDAAK